MDYKDLQNKAKDLGLPYAGVPRKVLEKAIAEKTGESTPKPPEQKEEKTPIVETHKVTVEPLKDGQEPPKSTVSITSKPPSKDNEKKTKVAEDASDKEESPTNKTANTATIYDGSFEVRVYTLDQHGKDFADMARQFVSSRSGFRLVLSEELPITTCPNCGSKVHCSVCGKDIH